MLKIMKYPEGAMHKSNSELMARNLLLNKKAAFKNSGTIPMYILF